MRKQNGFTLTETIVSIVILTIVIVTFSIALVINMRLSRRYKIDQNIINEVTSIMNEFSVAGEINQKTHTNITDEVKRIYYNDYFRSVSNIATDYFIDFTITGSDPNYLTLAIKQINYDGDIKYQIDGEIPQLFRNVILSRTIQVIS